MTARFLPSILICSAGMVPRAAVDCICRMESTDGNRIPNAALCARCSSSMRCTRISSRRPAIGASPTRTPRTLTVLFSDGGAITKESWSDTPVTNGVSKEMPIITASTLAAEHFQSLGYDTSQLAHWGRVPSYLHGFPTGCLAPSGWLYYAWPRRPTDPIVDFKAERPILKPLITANGRAIDGNRKRAQRLFEYYFHDVWWGGPSSEGQFELLLLDRDGRVIAQEQGSRPAVDPFKAVYNVGAHRYRVFIATPVTCRSQKQVDLVVARTIEDDQM